MSNNDPLLQRGWVEFNCEKWGLTSEVIELGPSKGTTWELKTILYFNSKQQLVLPPRNPHIPVSFNCNSSKIYSVNRRKRLAVESLVEQYSKHHIKGAINLSPVINDVRPFTWAGMSVEPMYTYHIALDGYAEMMDSSVLRKARKARKLGYTCEISNDFQSVYECLKGPEERKGFDHRVSAEELFKLKSFMGDNFICFLAKDKNGNPVGAWVRIFSEYGMAMGWSAGIKTEALKDGVNNLLGEFSLSYFHEKGCDKFDFVGANIPSVASMKEAWGGELTTYYSIRTPSLRNQLIINYKYAAKLFEK